MGPFDAAWHRYSVVRDGNTFTTYEDGLIQNFTISGITLFDESISMAIGKYQVIISSFES